MLDEDTAYDAEGNVPATNKCLATLLKDTLETFENDFVDIDISRVNRYGRVSLVRL